MTISLCVFSVMAVVLHLNGKIIFASGNLRQWGKVTLIACVLNISLSLYLGRIIGIQGVMVASVISFAPICIYLFYVCLDELRVTIDMIIKKVLIPAIMASLPSTLFVGIINLVNPQKSLLNMLLSIGIFSLCAMGGIFFAGLNNSERSMISEKVRIKRGSRVL